MRTPATLTHYLVAWPESPESSSPAFGITSPSGATAGQTIFFEDAGRQLYLQFLARHCSKHGVAITGYCLMTNHVHVLAVPTREDSLARAFGKAHNDYARWLNVRRGETGHFLQSRYFSCPLDEDHQWEALRYVELNPVRVGIAPAPERRPWSSAAAHLGLRGYQNRQLHLIGRDCGFRLRSALAQS